VKRTAFLAALTMAFLCLLFGAAGIARAADLPNGTPAALPETLSKEGARAERPRVAGVADRVHVNARNIRDRIHALQQAWVALPATLATITIRLRGAGEYSSLWSLAGYLASMLLVAWLLERLYAVWLRRYRVRVLQTPAQTFFAHALQKTLDITLDVGGIAAFGLGAFLVFVARWLEDDFQRIVVLQVLVAVVVVRMVALFARFLLARGPEGARLLPFADDGALTLRLFPIALAVLYGLTLVFHSLLSATDLDGATFELIRIAVWSVGLAMAFATIWRVRAPIGQLVRGDARRGSVRGWLADLWPVAATAYFLALFVGALSDVLAGMHDPVGIGLASVLIIVALPIMDLLLCRALAGVARGREVQGRVQSFFVTYEPIFRHGVHIVVVVAGILLIAELWQLDLFGMAQRSLGGRIASSTLGIGIVMLASYMLWAIARTAIDRRLQAEEHQAGDVPATRLRTLLPIARATALVTIFAMAAMSVLAALGVDILPLLAGASIVGVAIGFGSQTLVRDIVSGAFFLMDDAFRLGEYIEVGDAKGRVEKINLRSIFLRHHRGALNILPYGEIKRLRNTSRDWSVHVLEFRLTYDTSMVQVKKILQQIGEELSADPDYAPDIIQPLKSAGVMSAEDSAIVVRAKFTARPTNNSWVVRRMAYEKIIGAFRAAGIRFANRQVTVTLPDEATTNVVRASAAAAESATRRTDASTQP
jgi:small-conductance mechanosensitive channel